MLSWSWDPYLNQCPWMDLFLRPVPDTDWLCQPVEATIYFWINPNIKSSEACPGKSRLGWKMWEGKYIGFSWLNRRNYSLPDLAAELQNPGALGTMLPSKGFQEESSLLSLNPFSLISLPLSAEVFTMPFLLLNLPFSSKKDVCSGTVQILQYELILRSLITFTKKLYPQIISNSKLLHANLDIPRWKLLSGHLPKAPSQNCSHGKSGYVNRLTIDHNQAIEQKSIDNLEMRETYKYLWTTESRTSGRLPMIFQGSLNKLMGLQKKKQCLIRGGWIVLTAWRKSQFLITTALIKWIETKQCCYPPVCEKGGLEMSLKGNRS